MDGFDLNSPLVCEGIIGDGCGGGRLFYIQDDILKTYDPQTKASTTLLSSVKDAKSIQKKKCIIYIKCTSKTIEFDLSLVA